jgi:heterodisulfide reductase subunit A-like polyferredoxin
MVIPSGYVAHDDDSSYQRCQRCIAACPFQALSMGDVAIQIDANVCMGCGVCVSA